MFGQGGYGPPAMPPPPPFQQAPPPPPPPPLQQPPPPMPPPPFQHASSSLSQAPAPAFQHAPTLALPPPFQQNQSVPPPPPPIQPGQPHPVAPRTLLPQYQHGQTPLPLQHVPHPPPGAMNMGGPFLHIPPPNYANTHVMHSSTAQSHPVLPYPLPQNLHQGGPSGLPQSRGLPSIPPPPPLKGHAIYRNPPPPPAIQHVSTPDPPVPSGFVAANASFVHGPTDDAQPPYLPPPPPPPPPSSPPPLPPSPPPPALADEDPPETDSRLQFMGHQIENDASEKNQTDSALDKAQSADMMASEGSQGITDISGVVHPSMEGADIFTLSPPPSKPVESVVQNIETLCKFISKNGQQFESMVRAKESCNPQFAFLFGGEPGSAAAIGHEYFQWKKKIYSLEAESSNADQSIPLKRPLQSKQSLQIVTDESASLSLADSDMDMEDDVGHPAREQEISKCPNQFQEPVSINNIFSEKEGHLLVSSITSDKNQSYANSAAIKGTVEGDALESGRPPTAEATPATVQLPPVNEDDDVQQVLVKNGSPFRHIQGYASDSSSEDNIKDFISDVSPLRVSPKAVIPGSTSYEEPVAVTSAPDEEIFELNSDLDTQNALGSGYPMRVSTQLNSSSISLENFGSQKGSLPSHEEASPSVPVPCLLEGTAKVVDPSIYNQDDHSLRSIKESFEASQSFDVEEHGNGGTHDQAISFQPEDGAHKDTTIEVDEFGRRIRDVSDSDSDGIGHQWRHAKRERSSSRSLSPQEGRWRRKNRSPLRKKDKRSRSRSWSPRRLRSRSGSPVLRRTNGRRDHGQPPKCFNFLRGRCHRGSSCRYLHVDSGENRTKVRQQRGTHDSDKYDGRDHAIKEDHGVKNMHEEIMLAEYSKSSLEVSVGQELQLDEDLHVESVQDHPKYGTLDKKAKIISRDDDLKPVVLSPVAKPCKSEEVIQDHGSQNLIAEVEQEQVGSIQEVKSNVEQEESSRQKLEDHQLVPTERLQSQASSCNVEPPLDTQAAAQVSRSEGLFSSPSGLMQKDETSKNQCHGAEPHAPDQASLTQASSNLAHMNQPYANPQPFFQPVPGSEHLKSTFPGGGFHPHPYQLNMPQAHGQGPLYTPQFPSLPPPADYIRPFNQPFHSMNAPPRPSWTNSLQTAHMGDFSQRPPMGNQQIQEFGGPSAIREEDSSRNPVSASQFPSDLPKVYHFGPVHPTQPLPYSQQPASGLHYPVGSSFPSTSARLTDADISKVSLANHYNPFASTFEQTPRWSRYGSSFPSSHAPNNLGPRLTPSLSDGRAVVFSAQPGRALPIASSGEIPYHSYPMEPSSVVPSNFQKQLGSEVSVGDQYDPLLDSFETLKKPHLDKNPAVADADIIPNLSTSHRPIDQEDKSMQKSMPIASNFENEEFGETTMDAEIGAVENGSPLPDEGKDDYNADILDDLPNAAAGEIETERIPSPGKRKKSKDSRSMKLFKIAIANFVKEVLKPSWRQGNMSKEAFKTIVKKTVEKVSGAMPSHQVPKTQAKINHYVESSQRKLTKLVMGYVEKYVKV